jgi:LysM repeat protein
MLLRRLLLTAVCLVICHHSARPGASALSTAEAAEVICTVALGDTWEALARQFDLPVEDLLRSSGVVNPHRQPAVGSTLNLPETLPRNGRLLRPLAGGTRAIAA